jgi:hypothetical protein
MARSLIGYPLGVGELTEPWRLENTLSRNAQEHLELAATCLLAVDPVRLVVDDAYDIYTGMLCDAIDISLGIFKIVPITMREGSTHGQ